MRLEGLDPNQSSWLLRPLMFLMRRRLGKVPTPFKVMSRRPGIALAAMGLTVAIESSKGVAPELKHLVSLRAAQLIGCLF